MVRSNTRQLALLLTLALALPTLAAVTPSAATEPEPQRWIVGFDTLPKDARPGGTYLGADIQRLNTRIQTMLVTTEDPGFADAAQEDDRVVYVEADRYVQMIQAHVPNDPRWGDQYGPRLINLDDVWPIFQGGDDRIVCVIDSGIRSSHEEYQDGRYLGGFDWVGNDNTPNDPNGHGTFVSGIVAATMDNGKGIAGGAQVPFFHARVLGSTGSGSLFDLADAITWCADRTDIITMSLGCDGCTLTAL